MSNWTHVAGVIRIDDIRIGNISIDFDKLIGKEATWENLYEDDLWEDIKLNPENYLPMGSEGSLEKSIWVNPDHSCIAAYTVSIFGDLRDHDDPDAIIRWFENKIKEIYKYYAIRQATITVNNEYNGTKNWTFYYEDFKEDT